MSITCAEAGARSTLSVTALAGCSFAKWLGYRWVDDIPGDEDCGWFDLG